MRYPRTPDQCYKFHPPEPGLAHVPLSSFTNTENGHYLLLGGLDRRRKRRGILVAARSVFANRTGSEPQVIAVNIILAARVFMNFLVGFPGDPGSRVGEWPR